RTTVSNSCPQRVSLVVLTLRVRAARRAAFVFAMSERHAALRRPHAEREDYGERPHGLCRVTEQGCSDGDRREHMFRQARSPDERRTTFQARTAARLPVPGGRT